MKNGDCIMKNLDLTLKTESMDALSLTIVGNQW